MKLILTALSLALATATANAALPAGKHFDRAIFVVFENTNYADALAQPFFGRLAAQGASFTNLLALAHPSQGNYIAITSGALNGVSGDGTYNLDVQNLTDLLEAKGLDWRVYAEDYPGNCFKGNQGKYVRKHNPFISYLNVQNSPERCAKIVNAAQFDIDAKNGTLPSYVMYIPNLDNDGHDTGVGVADAWYSGKFGPYLADPAFLNRTILVSTFDESGSYFGKNQIYTSIVGSGVAAGPVNDSLTILSLLTLLEANWDLGNFGKDDATAKPMPNIWR
jgi:phospholipase C